MPQHRYTQLYMFAQSYLALQIHAASQEDYLQALHDFPFPCHVVRYLATPFWVQKVLAGIVVLQLSGNL